MSPLTLESELKRVATEAAWSRVVHRCAWCKRVENERGDYVSPTDLNEDTVMTDGMCPPCGARALASLRTRANVLPRAA